MRRQRPQGHPAIDALRTGKSILSKDSPVGDLSGPLTVRADSIDPHFASLRNNNDNYILGVVRRLMADAFGGYRAAPRMERPKTQEARKLALPGL